MACDLCGSKTFGHYKTCKSVEAKASRKADKAYRTANPVVAKSRAQLKSEGIAFRCDWPYGCDEWDTIETDYCGFHSFAINYAELEAK